MGAEFAIGDAANLSMGQGSFPARQATYVSIFSKGPIPEDQAHGPRRRAPGTHYNAFYNNELRRAYARRRVAVSIPLCDLRGGAART
jgi:hypothetical protein